MHREFLQEYVGLHPYSMNNKDDEPLMQRTVEAFFRDILDLM